MAALSQSGKSPDLIASAAYLKQRKQRGASVAAFVNTADSPLAAASDAEVLLPAGLEQSVAATKSYVAMLMAGVQTVAALGARQGNDSGLREALQSLPAALAEVAGEEWSLALNVLQSVDKMIVIGRGPALPIAQEAALKLKETSGIQAEAFSSAEVRHGPMEIIEAGYPVLVFAPSGPEQAGTLAFADDMRLRGAQVMVVAPRGTPGVELPSVATAHPLLEPGAVHHDPGLLSDGGKTGRVTRAQSGSAALSEESHGNALSWLEVIVKVQCPVQGCESALIAIRPPKNSAVSTPTVPITRQ